MKRSLLLQVLSIFLALLASMSAHAQLVANKGAVIVTKPSSIVMVNGAVQNFISGSIDDSGTITITTDLTNNASATAGGSGVYNIGGNYTNNGTWVQKTGLVNFNGTGGQLIGGTTITTFYDVWFTNGGGKTLTQKEIIQDTCTFTSGICYTSNTNVLNFMTTGQWKGGSSASYVDGPAEKDHNSTTEWRYPIGKQQRFNTGAVQLQAAASNTYRMEYFNWRFWNTTSMQSPLVVISQVQYWYCDLLTGSTSARVRLYWIPGDYTMASYMSTPSNLTVARWDTTLQMWTDAGANQINGTWSSGDIQSNYVTAAQFGPAPRPFTIASLTIDNALPVELGPFRARQDGDHIKLDWKTYTEFENLGFDISRESVSDEPAEPTLIKSWVNDEEVRGKSPWGAEYETWDLPPTPGKYRYRLYQIDANGTRRQLTSAEVEYREGSINGLSLSIMPSIVDRTARVIVRSQTLGETFNLHIFDMSGKEVASGYQSSNDVSEAIIEVSAESLAPGMYSAVVTNSQGQKALGKFIVQR
jgi:hypothetical protein